MVFAAVHRNAWFLFGSELGPDIIMAQTASRDASHGGRGDPGKWDRCPRSALGHAKRNCQAQRLSGLEVDHQHERGRLDNRQIGRAKLGHYQGAYCWPSRGGIVRNL